MKKFMRKADIDGTTAQAWKIGKIRDMNNDAIVKSYLLEGPFHVHWDRWVLSAIHLRDVPGLDPAVKSFPNATHEIWIVSLDPEHSDDIDPDKIITPIPMLSPPDATIQFEAISDEIAGKVLESMVQMICDGQASPDRDYRKYWMTWIPHTVQAFQADAIQNPAPKPPKKDKGLH